MGEGYLPLTSSLDDSGCIADRRRGDIIRGVLRSALRVRLYGELVLDDDDDDDEEGHSTISRPAKSHVM